MTIMNEQLHKRFDAFVDFVLTLFAAVTTPLLQAMHVSLAGCVAEVTWNIIAALHFGLTWNTTRPDFTKCFEDTVLLWPVCGFLWIAAIFDIYFRAGLRNNNDGFPSWRPGAWTWLGIFKMVTVTLVIFLQVGVGWMQLWYGHGKSSENVPDVYSVTPVVLISTHILSATLVVLHKMRCVHTSGIQLIYWLLLSILQGLRFRTKVRLYMDHGYDDIDDHSSDGNGERALVIVHGAALPLMILQSFLFCWSDIPKSKPGDHARLVECHDGIKREECPLLRSSCLSYLLFSYVTPLVLKGNKVTLTKVDMWDLIPSMKSRLVSHAFSRHYGKHGFGQTRSIYRNILKPLWLAFGWSYLLGVTFRLISVLIGYLPPTLMGYLIDFVEDKSIQQWKGYMWAVALFGIYILVTIFLEQFMFHMFQCYINVGTCIDLAIYRKALQISNEARKDKTVGEIVNLMSVDKDKIRQLIYEADAIWATPIQLAVGIILLWSQLGVAVLPGVAVLFAIVPINWALTSLSRKYQRAQMIQKDNRIKSISEILNGIQVIKLYAWEPPFQSQVEKVRYQELRIWKKRLFLIAIMQFVFDSIPFLVSVAAFFTYIFMSGGELDAKKAFTSVSLFTLLTEPITDLPRCIAAIVDALVSFERINNFFNAEEMDPNARKLEPGHHHLEGSASDPPAVTITDGNFAWEDISSSNFQLSNINLEASAGKLTAIVGSVASGKSSLLSAILGEMKKYSGEVTVRGKIAYAPQLPWVLNDTLRENVCFGMPYIKEQYDKVIDACCLIPDIVMLPAGDMTEIGEKGINLSGGQKQRVSLARLAYSGADLLILDDVLSAVDAHVGKRIWNRLIGPGGLLNGKTRVLCTHAYNFLSQVDHIVIMEGGGIIASGSYNDFMERGERNFSKLLINQDQTAKNDDGDADGLEETEEGTTKVTPSKQDEGKLIQVEHLETGDVKASVFLAYIKAMSYPLATCFVLFFFSSEGLSLGRNVVLSKWTRQAQALPAGDNTTGDMPPAPQPEGQSSYAIYYAILGISQSLFYLLGFLFLTFASLRNMRLLHNNMLKRILLAPMSFFNVTPLGRIVNRFSTDVESVDRALPQQIGGWICHIFKFLGILVAISYANGYFILFILPLSVLYFFIQRYYITCMQQLQRIVSANRSPIYAQFQETLQGTSTVRAYQAQERFCGLLSDKLDSFLRAFFPHMVVRRWLGIRLGFLGATIVLFPAMFSVIWRDHTDPSLVGLSISYALQVVNNLNWLVKNTSAVQYSFVSVERILQYTELEQEAALVTPSEDGQALSPDWPQNGSITFKEYGTRYRSGLDLVLKNFSCHIRSGEKIGIVGRTGAGKSSLTLALFRILEGVHGEIIIDGVNISRIGLHDLRRRMTVIPQDPVLFSSSLRVNLDPFGEYRDDELWEALRMAHLRGFVEELEGGLEYAISEGGENLSVGQRQLVCLARSILRKSNILVLDEATASVDNITDELIQQTIREHFVGCTILNVAHRLKTVLDSSRIMVLSQGEIIELDSPAALLANPNSHFYSMAKDAGITLATIKKLD